MKLYNNNNSITLYDLIGAKRPKSVLKSVCIHKNKNNAFSLCEIDVEAYDDTFSNATRYPSGQDRTYEVITKTIIKYQDKIKEFIGTNLDYVDVMHYSTFDTHFQDRVYFNEADRKRM